MNGGCECNGSITLRVDVDWLPMASGVRWVDLLDDDAQPSATQAQPTRETLEWKRSLWSNGEPQRNRTDGEADALPTIGLLPNSRCTVYQQLSP